MHFVSRVGRAIYSVGEFYRDINPSTLTGAIDVMVVEDQYGQLSCSPFHVRFGKLQLLRPQDKFVEIRINGKRVDLCMKVGEGGEAFFVMETTDPVPEELSTSPPARPRTPPSDVDHLDLAMPLNNPDMLERSIHGSLDPLKIPPRPRHVKSLRLLSSQLQALGLGYGSNIITFRAGRGLCSAKVYYWKHDVKIVVSDVDGTITKSDALGHLFNIVGKDWTHVGVAELFTRIRRNGYQILYLTARAIGQSDSTRSYLKSVEQGSFQLPDGPLIMSPDRLLVAFHREVIMRRPEKFKMACLRAIRNVFPPQINPFYAGFGNRSTDFVSYQSVGIASSRIFLVNPAGEVRLDLISAWKKSYVHLIEIVDHLFPPTSGPCLGPEDCRFWDSRYTLINHSRDHNLLGSEHRDKGQDNVPYFI